MGNIVLLDDLTINKIAAGEVIERPSSVVKELVENAIDAGATNINVEIKNGGISYIRVTDNGKGIMPDDMEIAFERHATSKIRTADDLETVKSMGFRGEALASIASIARVSMKSKTPDNNVGYEIIVEGGNILQKEETGCPTGTTITVENLFFNTPVRYKFLKKDFTEAGYIEDVMTRIALIHPEIAIKFISSGKTIIQTPGNGDMKTVVYNIYGKEIADNILDVNYEYEDIKVTGVIGRPTICRSNRANQIFFVNKRYVKDKTLSSSAEQGFKGTIIIGKFGFLILNVDVNPQKVDVNVHPAKLEVRFEEESKVFKAVYHAIKDTLLKNDLSANPEKEHYEESLVNKNISNNFEEKHEESKGLFQRFVQKKEEVPQTPTMIEEIYEKRKQNLTNQEDNMNSFNNIMGKMAEMSRSVAEYKENAELAKATDDNKDVLEEQKEETRKLEVPVIEDNQETKVITEEMKQEIAHSIENQETQIVDSKQIEEQVKIYENENKEIGQNFENMYTSVFGKAPISEENSLAEDDEKYKLTDKEMLTGENVSIFENTEVVEKPNYKFIGIAFKTYIIIEVDKEIYMIDQHAAHERILYEKVKENYYKGEGQNNSQLMLLPDIINLTHKEMDIAKENMDMFEKAGFILEEFGENTLKLTGVPDICLEMDTKELFLETLDEINTVARTAKQEIEDRFIATVACKAAVKANMVLSKEEVEELIENLLKLPNPFTCPHGRPTAIKMTRTDLEKKFSRR